MKHSSLFILITTLCLAACSTTSNLPEGELLYTGVKKIEVVDLEKSRHSDAAMSEVEAALSVPPNGALFGSSSIRSPFSFGLWLSNKYGNSEKGFGHWLYKKFGKDPKLISTINPGVRVKVASNLLHDYGYFRGHVTYDTVPAGKKKAKLSYQVYMGEVYRIDTILYGNFGYAIDSLLKENLQTSLLKQGDPFSVINVGDERKRIQTLLRNKGYYYFDPGYLSFLADTVHGPGKISLKMNLQKGVPENALKRWVIGKRDAYLYHHEGEELKDSVRYKDILIHYNGKLHTRPSVVYTNFRLLPGRNFSEFRNTLTSQRFSRLNTFQYTNLNYTPADSATRIDSLHGKPQLNVRLNAIYDAPYDAVFEMNFTSKSNSQVGPGAALTLTKKNVFKGGESLSLKLDGSYEWQTRNAPNSVDKSLINSWEMGVSLSLSIPRLLLPHEDRRDRRYSNSTDSRIFVTRMTRANYFRMVSFGGDFTYQYQSSPLFKHSITPLSLTFNVISASTERFDSILQSNPSLSLSLRNQFIPAMRYTLTFDNSNTRHRNKLWWQVGASSSGNITSLAYKVFGRGFNEEKEWLGVPFAQFLKLTGEVRYNIKLNSRQNLVFRFLTGAIWSYGNSTVAPYSEQFYIGGANSIRAFTIRSVGPGGYTPPYNDQYAYMDQTGEFKLEANMEYRFRLFGELYGATFLDAGNIWLIRNDPSRPDGMFKLSRLGKDIALGTGVGLRYDLDFLVLRLDAGYGLHAPYKTGSSGYFNIPKFKDAVALHLAIGYPF